MEITTNVTRKDVAAWRRFQRFNTNEARIRHLAWTILPPLTICACGGLLLTKYVTHSVASVWTLLPLGLAAGLYLFLFELWTRCRIESDTDQWLGTKGYEFVLGELLVRLFDDGVVVSGGGVSRSRSWGQIHKVLTIAEAGYIFTEADSAFIIPRRSFPDENAFDTFMKMAVIYHWNQEREARERSAELTREAREGLVISEPKVINP